MATDQPAEGSPADDYESSREIKPQVLGWLDPSIVALALLALCAGFGQFGAVSALGDVAAKFGHVTHGATLTDRAGLSGTELGIGLAILRLASLGGLFLAGLADHFGRRKVIIVTCGLGLACTALAAVSPTYWWFVAIFALGRPLLSTTSAVTQVGASEGTASSDRAKAIALVAAGYGVGAGLTAVIYGAAEHALGFRGVFALAIVPLFGLPFLVRRVKESDRYTIAAAAPEHPIPVFGAIGQQFRRRLLVITALAFSVSIITGPANSFVFIYTENVLGLSGAYVVAMVVVAGVAGLGGLLLGRLGADRVGRRLTSSVSMVAIALAALLTYSGSRTALFVGYEIEVFAASCFAPAAGAFANELFPTSIRASVAGWDVAASVVGATVGLLAFGSVADIGNRFAAGALVTCIPVVLASALFFLLPETRGKEPEDLWPDRN